MRKALLTMLIAALCVCAGCAQFQKPYELAEPLTAEDGTVYPAGTPVYVDAEGEPTFDAVDEDGVPHERLMEDDVEKIERIAVQAESTASSIPFGIGGLAGLIVGVAGSAAVGGIRRKRAIDREAARAKLKKKKA